MQQNATGLKPEALRRSSIVIGVIDAIDTIDAIKEVLYKEDRSSFKCPIMAPRHKALIAITSAHAPLYPDGKETGLFITEALHPFLVFKKAGFDVDLVSETGTYQPDWLSQQKDWLNDEDRAIWEDHSSEFRSKLDNLLKPSDIDPGNYGIFFASAGHASLIDYPDAKGLQNIASKMYTDGGIISAVCHGGAIFPGIIDPSTGKSIITNRKVTGFTTRGEEEEGVLDTIKSWNRPTIEASAAGSGATYVSPAGPWDAFTITDGRIVTGANPASAHVTAEAAVKAFNALVISNALASYVYELVQRAYRVEIQVPQGWCLCKNPEILPEGVKVFHEESFRQRYENLMASTTIPKGENINFLWLVRLVLGLGAYYGSLDALGADADSMRQLSRALLMQIEQSILAIIDLPSLEAVQICVLLGSFHLFNGRPTAGLVTLAGGLKTAQVIGLHHESNWRGLSDVSREARRRSWWALEVADKHVSLEQLIKIAVANWSGGSRYAAVAFGRPCTVDDSNCEVASISDIKIYGHKRTRQGPLLEYHQWKFKLYRIVGPLLSRRLQANRVESLTAVHAQLSSWKNELPDKLRLETYKDDPKGESRIIEMQALVLQLTYDNLQIILHRSAAFAGNERGFRSNGGATLYNSSREQLLESALRTSQLHQHAQLLQSCRKTHAVMHIGICLFTAGVVLCAIALAQPLSIASQKAKEGVMRILRLQGDSVSSQHLLSMQSVQILRDLVIVVMRSEERAILGHASNFIPERPGDDHSTLPIPQADSIIMDQALPDDTGAAQPSPTLGALNPLQQGKEFGHLNQFEPSLVVVHLFWINIARLQQFVKLGAEFTQVAGRFLFRKSTSNLEPQFEGWLGHDPTSADGTMTWGPYTPKAWDETDIDIRITHCSVCSSDLSTLCSSWAPADYPCCVGHEIVGIAIRVGVMPVFAGGVHQECESGRENYCHVHLTGTYNGRYLSGDKSFGGFARYHRAPSHFVFKVPDKLLSSHVAPMMCAGVTTYSALKSNGCGPGKNVGIIGIGGLGHFGILWAKALGAEKVVAISRRSNKRQDAALLGADGYVATEEDVDWAKSHAMTLDLLIFTVSSSQMPLESYLSCLRTDGCFVQIGLPSGKFPAFRAGLLASRSAKVAGSFIGAPREIREMLQVAVDKNVVPWVTERPMKEANAAIVDMAKGKPRYRYVLVNEDA
ncbi:hypothetical protein CNMCM8927_001428 [Aspergillus lentulus]|uniref:DJ-1/PfpI domain-containing protein n=1 Tax=Aspergillus lentulus TaxID=293939 RepID=A0AAN5YI86_ASPLE|nr:hypothetical protein CNMCM8927_001428 [Aspergillus lentulus]